MPEGDTLFRTAAGLRPYLVGRDVRAARAQGPGRGAAGPADRRQAHRRGRVAGQEPADPVRRRPPDPDPPADERLVAPLPARRALASTARSRPARARGRRRGRGLLRCPGGRAVRGADRAPPPVAVAAGAGPPGARLRCRRGASPPARPGARRPRDRRRARSTSERSPASATSTRTRSSGSSGSRRSPASRRSTTRPSSGSSPRRSG